MFLHNQAPQRSCTRGRAIGPENSVLRRISLSARAFVEHRASGERATVHGAQLVAIEYNDLATGKDVSRKVREALGLDGLGAVLITNVPNYKDARRELLPLARRFALLPDNRKAQYEDRESRYNFGWSHGKEQMTPGVRDVMKGSYYANPVVDDQLSGAALTEAEKEQLRRQHPGYYRPNIWPRADMPELEPAFKTAGRIICDAGLLLMDACDSYVAAELGTPRGLLSGVLRHSRNHKARLLHYFPPADASAACGGQQAWCGWHNDHGSLTGLMAAMYIDESGREVPCPDPDAGLYIRDRAGRVVRVAIPPDCLAFQVGETLQVHSGGLLRATAHYVRAAEGPAAVGVSRNTFAVFMQPDVAEPVNCPPGVAAKQVEVGQWRPSHNFGQFAEATFALYYPQQ